MIAAPWIGIPWGEWQGLDLTPGVEFWALLPVFVVVTLMLAINSISDGIVIQSASRRRPQATDFRVVQGALNANGVGVLLSGIAGTLPTMGYTAGSMSLIGLTGVAARSVGICIGAIFLGLRVTAQVDNPSAHHSRPRSGGLLCHSNGPALCGRGEDGFQGWFRSSKCHNSRAGVLDRNGGSEPGHLCRPSAWSVERPVQQRYDGRCPLTAILLTLFMELTSPRRRRLEVELKVSALPKIDALLRELASRINWNDASTERLRAAGEETLSSLLQQGDDNTADDTRRLIVVARPTSETVELEFIAVFQEENLEDRVAYLSEQAESLDETEISFRLLRHYASSVSHRKYHGIDIVTVRVEGTR